jgi:hypothetical protein
LTSCTALPLGSVKYAVNVTELGVVPDLIIADALNINVCPDGNDMLGCTYVNAPPVLSKYTTVPLGNDTLTYPVSNVVPVFLTAAWSTSVFPSGCSTADAVTIETPEDEPGCV